MVTGREWMDQGACIGTDPEAFFTTGKGEAVKPVVRKVCGGCEVRLACLEYAIEHGMEGFWGGASRHRRDLISGRKVAA